MATKTVSKEQLFGKYDVLLGGLGPTFEVAELSDKEKLLFDKFFAEVHRKLELVSPKIAKNFADQKDLILSFAKIFKAKVNEKSFTGEPTQPGGIGVGMLAPFDIHYTDSPSDQEPAYTVYGKYNWIVDVNLGQPLYLLGDASHFFKMSPIVGRRAMAVIIKDGIVEVGTTPSVNQFQVETEQTNYSPWRADVLYDVSIDPDRPLYIYRTPFAIPLWYDFGIKLAAAPTRTGKADIRFVGVVFFESDYYRQLVL